MRNRDSGHTMESYSSVSCSIQCCNRNTQSFLFILKKPMSMQPSLLFLRLGYPYRGLLLGLTLFAGLAACGPAASDNASNRGPNAIGSATRGTGQGGKTLTSTTPLGSEAGVALGKGTVPGGDTARQGDKLPLKSDSPSDVEAGRDKLPIPGIPNAIAKGLDSPDVLDRLQALDHWEKKGSKPPLDPVFEALEDENEAVRAKATAIIEQQWVSERERG